MPSGTRAKVEDPDSTRLVLGIQDRIGRAVMGRSGRQHPLGGGGIQQLIQYLGGRMDVGAQLADRGSQEQASKKQGVEFSHT
jgi:hypothetical protein